MRFLYLRDPLFVSVFVAYWLNRMAENLNWSPRLLQCYLNDFICVPFWIPILVWMTRKLGTRTHDLPPSSWEILFPMIVWATLFELVFPVWFPQIPTTGDLFDVVAYFTGGLASALFWKSHYSAICSRNGTHLTVASGQGDAR